MAYKAESLPIEVSGLPEEIINKLAPLFPFLVRWGSAQRGDISEIELEFQAESPLIPEMQWVEFFDMGFTSIDQSSFDNSNVQVIMRWRRSDLIPPHLIPH